MALPSGENAYSALHLCKENEEICENGMISIEDIIASKWDIDLIRGALDSLDSIFVDARQSMHVIATLEPLMDRQVDSKG